MENDQNNFFFLGIIEESETYIVVKDDDGSEIKLKLLKNPISLEDLTCEYEQDEDRDAPIKIPKFKSSFKTLRRTMKHKKIDHKNSSKCTKYRRNVTFLKEPISLDDLGLKSDEAEPVTFNVKTVEKSYLHRVNKKLPTIENLTWKQNALTLFEFSHVYPFIHASNKYKCMICAKSFLESSVLKEHLTYHSIEEFKRELMNRTRDKSLKVDVSYLQCKICFETIQDFMSLKSHLKEHGKKIDPNFQDNLIPFNLSGNTFECQICHENFLKLRLLTIHMSKHFNNFHCEKCGSVFISLNLLKRHLQTHKNDSFPCEKCDKVFSNSAKRTLHMRGVHLKQYPRTCPMCPERFNSNYKRMKHLRIVHNQTTGCHRCETCGREYDLKYQLLKHVRSVHLQERNQECNICHARFFSKYCLSRHMVIHTGEKNFKCEVCGKAYARKKSLREHSKSHDVSQTLCSICGQDCDDNPALVLHLNTTHGII